MSVPPPWAPIFHNCLQAIPWVCAGIVDRRVALASWALEWVAFLFVLWGNVDTGVMEFFIAECAFYH